MGRALMCGVMVMFIKESGLIIIFMGRVSILGWMEDSMLVNGIIIICMESDTMCGQMEECIRENILMIRKTGMDSILGMMEGHIKGFGRMESNMAMEFMYNQSCQRSDMVSGIKAKGLLGLLIKILSLLFKTILNRNNNLLMLNLLELLFILLLI